MNQPLPQLAPIALLTPPAIAQDIGPDDATPAVIAAIAAVLATDSPRHARIILTETSAAGFDLADEAMRPVLRDMLARALLWLESATDVVPTLDLLASLGPDAAMAAFDLLFVALFPDGIFVPLRISNSAVVILARLIAEVGYLDDGLAFFDTAQGRRDPAVYLPLVDVARRHMLGLEGNVTVLSPGLPAQAGCG